LISRAIYASICLPLILGTEMPGDILLRNSQYKMAAQGYKDLQDLIIQNLFSDDE
jgi:hypothetical protein